MLLPNVTKNGPPYGPVTEAIVALLPNAAQGVADFEPARGQADAVGRLLLGAAAVAQREDMLGMHGGRQMNDLHFAEVVAVAVRLRSDIDVELIAGGRRQQGHVA